MRKAIDETDRRREIQEKYNKKHGIVPHSIKKSVESIMLTTAVADSREVHEEKSQNLPEYMEDLPAEGQLDEMLRLMRNAAKELNFEYAAFLRDQIKELQKDLNTPTDVLKKKKRKAPFRKLKRIF